MTPTQIELIAKYENGDFRLSLERLDFILPQIIDLRKKDKFLNLRPEYQRRLVWDQKKKSLLIESLLMNVPIPPVFLFESDWNEYEVMDGQQRLNTIIDFLEDRFVLKGLERWQELNTYAFSQLPDQLKRGLLRRKLPATVLLTESVTVNSSRDDVRQLVFERLNTGGQQLNAQELRNCIFSGPFNDLMISLAAEPLFCRIWDIPQHTEGGPISTELSENRHFKRMLDCEIVLRFFAFRGSPSQIKGAVRSMLDRCMKNHRPLDGNQCKPFRQAFLSRLELAHDVFGDETFRLPKSEGNKLSEPLYDAIMIAFDRQFEQAKAIRAAKAKIIRKINSELRKKDSYYELVVGRANTAKSIQERIATTEKLILDVL